MPVYGGAGEVAGEPGRVRVGRHVGVDGGFDEPGADDVGRGLEEDGDGGDGGLELVGEEIAEETAHDGAVVDLAHDVVILGEDWLLL